MIPIYFDIPANFNPLFPYGKRRYAGVRHAQHHPISIHSSHTGRDVPAGCCVTVAVEFQSTLPIREETHRRPGVSALSDDFNPLFPYGKRRGAGALSRRAGTISIHSSHTGRDPSANQVWGAYLNFNPLFPYGKRLGTGGTAGTADRFQSTLPIREETMLCNGTSWPTKISIHSSHTGRDNAAEVGQGGGCHFNPLFPYGKRRFRIR